MITIAAAGTLAGVAQIAASVTITVFGLLLTTAEAYGVIYQGQPTGSVATLYTVPGSTTALIKGIHVVNTVNVQQTFALYVNGVTDAKRITTDFVLPPLGMAVYDGSGWRIFARTVTSYATRPTQYGEALVIVDPDVRRLLEEFLVGQTDIHNELVSINNIHDSS